MTAKHNDDVSSSSQHFCSEERHAVAGVSLVREAQRPFSSAEQHPLLPLQVMA
jgi:hypothetical protein